MIELSLDLRGLKCPLPVLRTRKALIGLQGAARLHIACTDPMAAIDIPHFIKVSGQRLTESRREDNVLHFTIEKTRSLPLAAVIYAEGEDCNSLLRTFANEQIEEGFAVSGLVQRNGLAADCVTKDMELEDLASRTQINICQALGSQSTGCRIDPQAMARAAGLLRASFGPDNDLVIINKFGKLEAEKQGLLSEIAEAYGTGVPLLVGVPDRFLEAWHDFAGEDFTSLPCSIEALRMWWASLHAGTPGSLKAAAPAP